jgi:glyoxylase-like metal-dependent hydrolase (beta-lactamase superfamily II)
LLNGGKAQILSVFALSELGNFHGFVGSEANKSKEKNMDKPTMFEPRSVAPDTEALISYVPLPGLGILPANAFLIRGAQPVLVDTGLIGLRDEFMQNLRSLISLQDLRWLWLTHTHPDHIGSLTQILDEAPNARLITTYLAMGLMGLSQIAVPMDRVYLLNPGQSLDIGDRKLMAIKPPSYDSAESTGFLDTKTNILFVVDCFGTLMKEPAESASDIAPSDLRDGLIKWATLDAPWLSVVDEGKFNESLDAIRNIKPVAILSSHLPPATGMTEILLKHFASAQSGPPSVAPDQAALEQMLAGASG